MSLSDVHVLLGDICGIQVYIPSHNIDLENLCGKIKEINKLELSNVKEKVPYAFDFRFEFIKLSIDNLPNIDEVFKNA